MTIKAIFPIHIWASADEAFSERKEELTNFVYELEKNDTSWDEKRKNIQGYGISGYTSYYNQQTTYDSSWNSIKEFMTKEAISFLNTMYKDDVAFDLEISDQWVNLSRKGCYHGMHNHGYQGLSGIYYLKVPSDSGADLILQENRGFECPDEKVYGSQDIIFQPAEGDFIIFPSFLYHKVNENRGDEDRISISFNWKVNILK